MKLLFIYESTELKEAGSMIYSIPVSDYVHVLTVNEQGKRNLYDVADNIKKRIRENEPCVIFIDQYLTCADDSFTYLQKNSGIAIIKFLRMMDVTNHIVLITPFSGKEIELVKQNPGNMIITSSGISFAKYLHEFRYKTKMEFEILAAKTFDANRNLKPYILAEFHLPEDERHNWANWWGIDRLWKIHRAVEREKYGLTERWNLVEYPDGLKNKLKALRNREALFLYDHHEKFIVNDLMELNEETNKLNEILQRYVSARNIFIEDQNNIQSQRNEKTSQIDYLESQISIINKLLPQLNGLSESFLKKRGQNIRRLIELTKQISELDDELMKEKQRTRQISHAILNKEIKLDELNISLNKEEEKYLSELQSGIDSLENEIQKLQSKIMSLSIPALREKLQKKSPKIFYIDDQADEGWSNIFRHIIYNKVEQELFKVIQPKETDKINEQYFAEVVCPEIISNNPDLILLDLRLSKESGIRIEVENLSGAILLKEIRKQFAGIPVLMTTASNKSWSFEVLQRIGSDGFWTKEGIDTAMTEKDSIKNYLRFAELVNILTDQEYGHLRWFASKLKEIKAATSSWWWETSKFAFEKKVDRDEVDLILTHTLFIIREYLRNEVINPQKNHQTTTWLLPSLIIHNLGKIPELIYNTWNVEYMFDSTAKELFKIRNNASHIVQSKEKRTVKDFSFVDSIDFCKRIFEYLTLEKIPSVIELKEISEDKILLTKKEVMKNIEISNKKRKR